MFKPRPETYTLVTKEFACRPADVVFVSSNRWDAFGATAFGFRTVWINRSKAPDEYPGFAPAAVAADLSGVLTVGLSEAISGNRLCRRRAWTATRPTRNRISSSRSASARRRAGRTTPPIA